ncbi:MAG: peptide chain release factor 1 [Planctomycetaceae bacterium]|jgi:peptide chain release factor 1|nr:peptide chain release factor 1 [Planctomycetaceae bacterium]MDC0273643.1 peptide chain release factor 1 [Planctomycetaceae bacterium]MDG2390051.1 peptide chain release factor 1 [Planctomycetaceae bacterium]
MFPSLEIKLKRYEELELLLQDPAVMADVHRMLELQREYGGLQKIAVQVREFNELEENISAAQEMLDEESDKETREYAQAELDELTEKKNGLEEVLEDLATAGDSITRGSLIMEVRGGTGGEEAALFARDLFDMYTKYAESRGWKYETIDFSASDMGGFKDITFSISGESCFHELQFESGGHRVQRVPETETQGRIHTSAATVAVMPEATDVEIDIKPEDIRIDTMRAGGPGGQKVNKTESAVRITHLESGIVVKCQDEKSQHKNRASAMRVLRSRLFDYEKEKVDSARAEQRRTLIGSGDRSQRIRTYNFPQNRITDHRIGLTLHKLDKVLAGEMDELIKELLEFDRQERLGGNNND